ncbi:MAG: ABC transporter ATP-binding protein, partial [Alphaproteobacteria bacterium]
MSTVLELSNLSKTYGGATPIPVLQGVNLTIAAGESVAVIGQSGSGKSTLLHVAGLLDVPTSGDVAVNGINVKGKSEAALAAIRNSTFGFVYQHHHILREFTALENVMMPALIAGKSKAACHARATELLESVNLTPRASHLPSQLSGGECQRVAVARALMNQPKLLLADEPTGNLDPRNAAQVADMFFHLVDKERMALLLVTHNEALAARCQRVYRMEQG